ncbi:MAG: hypothetical protein ACYDIA_24680, partial [Candidatus Humimicrobiaceae bacterium]
MNEREKIDIGDFYSDYSNIKHEFGWDLKISIPAGEYPGHRGLTEMWFNVRDESIKNVPDDS